jgi:hypothetical protein
MFSKGGFLVCLPLEKHDQQQWRNYYELGPGAPNPNGGPQAQAIAYRTTMPFSDHQNSVKSLPKVREMIFQRV